MHISTLPSLRSFARRACLGARAVAIFAGGQLVADETFELPKVAVYSEQVANQTPANTFAMPVSGLRFEPRVDVQARNLAEGQADVAIRGGVFENTGFKVGALALFDPQTGHYFAEIPVAPAMLSPPKILTGADNALAGFNAGVGSVAYGWRPVAPRGEAAVAFGDYATNRQSFYQGVVAQATPGGQTLAADVDLARSASDGSVPSGDHDFKRAAGRVQLRGPDSQTDFFAGWQRKFFGWPNLYTPFGVNETEDLHTDLYVVNHRAWNAAGDWWQLGAFYRRNYDDYEFNRSVPGQFNPYQHTTHVRAVALEAHQQLDGWALAYGAQAMRDSLASTALTFGPYNSRSFLKLSAVPELAAATSVGRVLLRAGATYDQTNRDGSKVSPLASVVLARSDGARFHAEYSETTQVPTYTALKSNPAAGLFRGNPNLSRTISRNLEAGAAFKAAGWSVEVAIFHRRDDRLVDWTFTRASPNARSANAVDTATTGAELVATRRTARCDLVLGYTWLAKTADYGLATIDASFYALNFAKHRLTAAVVARLGAGLEVRLDNEYRVQEKNLLRTVGGDHALTSAAGLYYLPPALRGLELSLLVDNLWDGDFQEVPAVRAARRTYSLGAAYRW